jgi:N-methylhydantoinase B
VFRLDTPGGGGSGYPLKRDPATVVADVNEGYVTPQAAERDYGVALTRDGRRYKLDAAGTEKLRASATKREQFTEHLKAAV